METQLLPSKQVSPPRCCTPALLRNLSEQKGVTWPAETDVSVHLVETSTTVLTGVGATLEDVSLTAVTLKSCLAAVTVVAVGQG